MQLSLYEVVQLCTLSGFTGFFAGDSPHTAVFLNRISHAVWLNVGALLLTYFSEL